MPYKYSLYESFGMNHRIVEMLKDLESNAQWNNCIDVNGASLGRCVNDCQNESECENSCLDVFKAQQLNCPCEVRKHECILTI